MREEKVSKLSEFNDPNTARFVCEVEKLNPRNVGYAEGVARLEAQRVNRDLTANIIFGTVLKSSEDIRQNSGLADRVLNAIRQWTAGRGTE